jgi:hypothetical protein
VIALPKPGKDPKFPQNLRPISLLSSTGKVFEKVILEIANRYIGERNLLNASQFGFRALYEASGPRDPTLCATDATDRKEGYVLGKIQSRLDSMAAWCKHWNTKINEDKTRAIYFTRRNRSPDSLPKLNGRNIPFVNSVKYLGVLFDKRTTWRLHKLNGRNIPFLNSVKYLGVLFDKRTTWRLHKHMIEAKAFRTFIKFSKVSD